MGTPIVLVVCSMGVLLFAFSQMGAYFNSGDEEVSMKKEELASIMEKVNRIEQWLGAGLTALVLGVEAGIIALIQLSVWQLSFEGWVGGLTNILVILVSGCFGVLVFRLCLKKPRLGNLLGSVAVLGIIALLIMRWLYIHGMPSDLTTLLKQLF